MDKMVCKGYHFGGVVNDDSHRLPQPITITRYLHFTPPPGFPEFRAKWPLPGILGENGTSSSPKIENRKRMRFWKNFKDGAFQDYS